jgi:hypothetical protein
MTTTYRARYKDRFGEEATAILNGGETLTMVVRGVRFQRTDFDGFEPQDRKKGKRINKLQCVREALGELGNDAQPKDNQDFLKCRFNLDMTTKFISTYKGTVLREAARKSGIIRQPAARVSSPAPAPPKASPKVVGTNGGISVEDIRAVKGLVEKIGAEAVKELAEVLSD